MRFCYLLLKKPGLTFIIGLLLFLNNTELLKAQFGLNAQGCSVHIKPGTNLHVDGNVHLENNGQFNNSGEIEIKGDWLNNSGTVGFISSTGLVKFNGDNQSMGGSSATTFNNIDFLGTGTKILSNTSEITLSGNLTVGDSGISNVVLINQHTNLVLINGNFTVNSGSTYQNNGAGFNVVGNMSIKGSFTGKKDLIFSGSSTQIISGTALSQVNSLSVNKTNGFIQLAIPVTIDSLLVLIKGIIVSDSRNLLIIDNSANVTGGGDTSYVSGPLKKIGNSAFTFPLGDKNLTSAAYHPLSITAPVNTADAFTAQYFANNQMFGDSLEIDSLESISNCEYFDLTRNAGTSVVIPSVSWNTNSCNVSTYDLSLAYWDSTNTEWKSMGNGGINIEGNRGTLKGEFGVNTYRLPLLIGLTKKGSTKVYGILKRELDASYIRVKNGVLKFKFDEEYNDLDEKLSFKIYNNLYHNVVTNSATLPLALQLPSDYGERFYTLNILDCAVGNLGNGMYILEVQNEKNEKWYLRFKHVTSFMVVCGGFIPG